MMAHVLVITNHFGGIILNSFFKRNTDASVKKGGGNSHSFILLIVVLTALLLVSICLTMTFGAVRISPSDIYHVLIYHLFGRAASGAEELLQSSIAKIIWEIRLPRVLLGIIAGVGLSVCGTVMQSTVQNPLAEPYILGISSGASLGATFAVFMGTHLVFMENVSSISVLSFLGALGATAGVLMMASIGGTMTSGKLILSGTVINALCSSFSNFIISMAGDGTGMLSIKFWTMGSLTRAKWNNLFWPFLVVLCCCIFFISQYRNLNTMLLGDEAASTLGVNLTFYRKLYMLAAALLTGIIVSNCGVIGFVGLMVPHISRALVGADHRRLLPVAILLGGIFLTWADAFARIVIPGGELAIGIVTSMIGAPFFAYILVKRHYHFGS